MFGADLNGARLLGTDFSNADLRNTDLRGTTMKMRYLGEEQELGVDLFAEDSNTLLYHANLIEADLDGAYLEGATLPHESLLNGARLPNGKRYDHFKGSVEMKKFTDTCHTEFPATFEEIELRRLGNREVATSDVYSDPNDKE